jgi:group I intron endonuclease
MHYQPDVDFAFSSTEHIMRDVNAGWAIRYTHANVASFFFIFVYAHISRGLYYSSYREPRSLVWTIGVVILVLMMATAFLGYYKRSPKWSKFTNYSKFNLFTKLDKKQYVNCFRTSNNYLNFKTSVGFRYYSTSTPTDKGSVIKYSNITLEDLAINKDKTDNSNILKDFIIEKRITPVYCYEDLHLDSTRQQIKTETIDLGGIYLILNKETLDYYIGSAATNKFYARFSNHLLYFRGSKIVKLAVKTYKLSHFAFIVLELFPEVVNKYNNKQLLDLEDFYLKSLLPNYNILTEAGNNFGYKHTEVTRIKMINNYSQERRERIGNLNRGLNLSKETIEKIRYKRTNRETSIYSEPTLLNMKKNSKPIILYNLNNTVYGEFASIVEAAKSTGCNEKTIRRSLKTNKNLLKRRWIVKYL